MGCVEMEIRNHTGFVALDSTAAEDCPRLAVQTDWYRIDGHDQTIRCSNHVRWPQIENGHVVSHERE